jgi:protein-disulfide isomerase
MTALSTADRRGRDRRASHADRAEAARERVRQAEQRRRRRHAVATAVVLAVVVAAGVLVQAARSSTGDDGVPAGATRDSYGFALGSPTAKVTVEIYEDFLCPACEQLERSAAAELRRMAAEGQVRVVYRPMAFLDGYSTNRYSTRSLNAAGCAADEGVFVDYHDQLFAVQPAEGGPGLTDRALVALGSRAGASGAAFRSCVVDGSYLGWTRKATEAASLAGVVQTPTVLVNGRELGNPSLADFNAAITAAG